VAEKILLRLLVQVASEQDFEVAIVQAQDDGMTVLRLAVVAEHAQAIPARRIGFGDRPEHLDAETALVRRRKSRQPAAAVFLGAVTGRQHGEVADIGIVERMFHRLGEGLPLIGRDGAEMPFHVGARQRQIADIADAGRGILHLAAKLVELVSADPLHQAILIDHFEAEIRPGKDRLEAAIMVDVRMGDDGGAELEGGIVGAEAFEQELVHVLGNAGVDDDDSLAKILFRCDQDGAVALPDVEKDNLQRPFVGRMVLGDVECLGICAGRAPEHFQPAVRLLRRHLQPVAPEDLAFPCLAVGGIEIGLCGLSPRILGQSDETMIHAIRLLVAAP